MKAKPAELVLSLAVLSLGIAVAIGTAICQGRAATHGSDPTSPPP